MTGGNHGAGLLGSSLGDIQGPSYIYRSPGTWFVADMPGVEAERVCGRQSVFLGAWCILGRAGALAPPSPAHWEGESAAVLTPGQGLCWEDGNEPGMPAWPIAPVGPVVSRGHHAELGGVASAPAGACAG